MNANVEKNTIEPLWEVGGRVLVKNTDGFQYEAEIIQVVEYSDMPAYKIHYIGWNQKYDKVIAHVDAIDCFFEATQEAIKKANEDIVSNRIALREKRRSSSAKREIRELNITPVMSSSSRRSQNKQKFMSFKVESPIKKIEPIRLPLGLKQLIEIDKLVSANGKHHLPVIPSRFSVDRIIQMYHDSLEPADSEERRVFTDKLLSLFNSQFRQKLITYFEEPMCDAIANRTIGNFYYGLESQKPDYFNKANWDGIPTDLAKIWSFLFGLAHLMRFFNYINSIIEMGLSEMSDLYNFVECANEFVKYLDDNKEEFYDVDEDFYPMSIKDRTGLNLRFIHYKW